MTPSDPTLTPPSPDDQDLLLDAVRGELSPRAAEALAARLGRDEALEAERARLERFVAYAEGAHEPPADRVMARRIALRVRDRVAAEETSARRDGVHAGSRRRLVWGLILTVSVAAHVLVLALVAAFHVSRAARPDPARELTAHLPSGSIPQEEQPFEAIPDAWAGVTRVPGIPEESPLRGTGPAADLGDLDLAPLLESSRRFDHPQTVALEMVVRRTDGLKRKRLDRCGLDAAGTMRVVEKSLSALAKRQRPDGSFPPGGGRSVLGQTGLALLPYLADGMSSRTGDDETQIVGRGVAWLRGRLFAEDGALQVETREPIPELGMVLRALSEDYMLSYGRLAPAEAQRRAVELRSLATRVELAQGEDGAFPGSREDARAAVWPMWALEAAVRTGAFVPQTPVPERFGNWYAATDRNDATYAAAGLLLGRALGKAFAPDAREHATAVLVDTQSLDPFLAATAGAGLLLHDADAFRAWNAAHGERLLRAVRKTGIVQRGDAVGDTALHVLALQVAYRTY